MPRLLQNSHILTKPNMTCFDEQRAIALETMDLLELEQDILVLSILSKFHNVPFEITPVRPYITNNGKIHKQRALTPEGIL